MRRFLLFAAASVLLGFSEVPAAFAETGWKAEFDAVCGQTDNAMNMSVAELKKSLEQCDRLKEKVEQLEPTPRKVYLKRLQMCRNLFSYMMETREKAAAK